MQVDRDTIDTVEYVLAVGDQSPTAVFKINRSVLEELVRASKVAVGLSELENSQTDK